VNGNSATSRSNTARVPAIPGGAQQPRFLSTADPSNPQALKRSVLASFTNALLLPVTLVPRAVVGGTRAVGAGIGAGIVGIGVGMGAAGNAAAQGLGMLNPSKWGGTQGASSSGNGSGAYKTDFESEDAIFEVGDDDDDDAATMNGRWGSECMRDMDADRSIVFLCSWVGSSRDRSSIASGSTLGASTTTSGSNHKPTGSGPSLALASASASADVPAALDHLLSLDTALSLIHASRESLKRAETFAAYPAPMGHRVRDTLAELFVLLLVALEGRHVGPGFEAAKRAMEGYRPSTDLATAGFADGSGNGGEAKVDEPAGGMGGEVAPLVGFFELVHVGDTIASMVDVYYDKEIVSLISTSYPDIV
jgi:recyclin-1